MGALKYHRNEGISRFFRKIVISLLKVSFVDKFIIVLPSGRCCSYWNPVHCKNRDSQCSKKMVAPIRECSKHLQLVHIQMILTKLTFPPIHPGWDVGSEVLLVIVCGSRVTEVSGTVDDALDGNIQLTETKKNGWQLRFIDKGHY